jgi:UDPglucose 6-dehydrogenase
MKMLIIGAGIVGQATGLGFAEHGHEVAFYDIDGKKLEALREKGFEAASKIGKTVLGSEVFFVCVPTPTVNGEMDFRYIQDAVVKVGRVLRENGEFAVVVVRSTVLPTTTRSRVVPLLERCSGLRVGEGFGVCMNPEFLRERHALEDFQNPSRIVIGESDKRSGDMLEKLYSAFRTPIIRTDLDSAEMIKYAANCFLAAKISYFNEIYSICQRLGLDSEAICKAVSLDSRIGNYGIHGGRPFAGMCLPKDVEALTNFARKKGMNPSLLEAILKVNDEVRSKSQN